MWRISCFSNFKKIVMISKPWKDPQNLDQVIEFKQILKMRPKVMKRSVKYSTEGSKIGSKNSKTLWPSDIKDFEVKFSCCEWSERSSPHSSLSVWSQLFWKNRMHIREWKDNCQKLSILCVELWVIISASIVWEGLFLQILTYSGYYHLKKMPFTLAVLYV